MEYAVEGWYDDSCGWEIVCREDSYREIEQRHREYRENEPQFKHRIVRIKES